MRKLWLLAAAGLAVGAAAAVPPRITYQGRLVDGTNLVNGTVELALRLYDAPTEGNLLYEDIGQVIVADGLYATFLGDQSTTGSLVTALAATDLYLEVAVSSNTLAPREPVTSVAYALIAAAVSAEAITSTMLASGAVTSSKLAPQAVTAGALASNAVTAATIADGTIGVADLNLPALDARYVNANGDTVVGNLNVNGAIISTNYGANKISFYYHNAAMLPSFITYHGMFVHIHDEGKAAFANGARWVRLSNEGHEHSATEITTGTLSDVRLSGNVSLLGQTIVSPEIVDGTITASDVASNTFWKATGNAGTVAGTNFVGTTDNQPLEFRVNGQRALRLESTYSLAAGRRAKAIHDGSFVWGDAQDADVQSATNNEFVIRAEHGMRMVDNAGVAGAVRVGDRFRDNALVAWAKITGEGAIQDAASAFGVAQVTNTAEGSYTITLQAAARDAAHLIPIAVPEIAVQPVEAAQVRLIAVHQAGTGDVFEVFINSGTFAPTNNAFVFMCTAR